MFINIKPAITMNVLKTALKWRENISSWQFINRVKIYQLSVNLCHVCCRTTPVRHGLRLRGQDTQDRVQGRRTDPVDPSQLRKVFHHHLQWPRQHRMERQLHVPQIPPSPSQQVSKFIYEHVEYYCDDLILLLVHRPWEFGFTAPANSVLCWGFHFPPTFSCFSYFFLSSLL